MEDAADTLYSDCVPNESSLVLLICEAVLKKNYHIFTPPQNECLHNWFLDVVALNCIAPRETTSNDEEGESVTKIVCSGNEVDFTLACEGCLQPLQAPTDTKMGAQPQETTSSSGFNTLHEFVALCYALGGYPMVCTVVKTIIEVLGARDNSPVNVTLLSNLCCAHSVGEQESVSAVGSVTKSFQVLMNVSWTCASFSHQNKLAKKCNDWLLTLQSYVTDKAACLRELRETASEDYFFRRGAVNLDKTYSFLRDVFEGCRSLNANETGCGLARIDPASASPCQMAKFLSLSGATAGASGSFYQGDTRTTSTQKLLFDITSGMLLYVQFYLNVRSLASARLCSQMAVLLGNQLHMQHILALAHYSCFVVHLHTGNVLEAADSLSIALQIAADERDESLHPVASLCYLGASQLLLFFPSAVGASLRSVLAVGLTGSTDESGAASSSPGAHTASAGRPPVPAGDDDLTENGTGNTYTIVQTIPQTARSALNFSEKEAFLATQPGSDWVNICSILARESALLVGAIFGIVSSPMVLDSATVGRLLHLLHEDAVAPTTHRFSVDAFQPRSALLTEMIRHASLHALFLSENVLSYPCEVAPADLLSTFFSAVETHYGPAALAMAKTSVLCNGVSQYLAASSLAEQGYTTLSYRRLSDLVDNLIASSRCDANRSEESCSFWPPELLLLLVFVQVKRAELAFYLHFPEQITEIQTSLNALCASRRFVFGLLAAQLIEVISQQYKGNFGACLTQLDKLENSMERIGVVSLRERVIARRSVSLARMGKWSNLLHLHQGALDLASSKLQLWLFIGTANAKLEQYLLLTDQGTVLDQHLLLDLLDSLSHFPVASIQTSVRDSHVPSSATNVPLMEMICFHATALRIAYLLVESGMVQFSTLCQRLDAHLDALVCTQRERHLATFIPVDPRLA